MDGVLTIKDFSELSGLSATTLRHYHEEGLLVPAAVEEYSSARRYALDQLPRAVLVSAMRRAGLGVQQMRTALDEAGPTAELLQRHRERLDRRRAEEDEALAELFAAVEAEPQVRRREVDAVVTIAVTLPARVTAVVDDAGVRGATSTAVRTLRSAAEEHRWTVVGAPRTRVERGGGLAVELPLRAAPDRANLPDGVEVRRHPAAAEASVVLPGRHRHSQLALASWHFARAFVQDAVVGAPAGTMGDFRLRWAESDTLTEYAMGLDEPGGPSPVVEAEPGSGSRA